MTIMQRQLLMPSMRLLSSNATHGLPSRPAILDQMCLRWWCSTPSTIPPIVPPSFSTLSVPGLLTCQLICPMYLSSILNTFASSERLEFKSEPDQNVKLFHRRHSLPNSVIKRVDVVEMIRWLGNVMYCNNDNFYSIARGLTT